MAKFPAHCAGLRLVFYKDSLSINSNDRNIESTIFKTGSDQLVELVEPNLESAKSKPIKLAKN